MGEKARLVVQMIVKGVLGFVLLGLLLFVSAGTLGYPNGWMLIIALGVLMLAMGMVLLVKDPETLGRRMKTNEGEKAQRGYMGLIGLLYLASFVLAGLDFRFGWSRMPMWGCVAALVVLVAGYGMYCAVILQNAYASRVVEVQEGQQVISTGLYAVVRHPMYLASLLVFLPMPLVLGSWVALVPMLGFPFVIGLRIKNEEAVLQKGLPGYAAYMEKTRYRLIPYIW